VPPVAQPQPVYRPCHDCGIVESVRQVGVAGQGTGAGAVIGGAAGGVLGHQIGNGRGQDVATVLGAIGGAIAGHQVERHARKTAMYEVEVRMEDGSVRTFQQADPPVWRQGDNVRVTNGALARAS
jgi:outer membrane lipoprotein SlyB